MRSEGIEPVTEEEMVPSLDMAKERLKEAGIRCANGDVSAEKMIDKVRLLVVVIAGGWW